MVRGWNPAEGKIFTPSAKGQDWFWGPPSVVFGGYRGSFAGLRRPGRDVDH